MLFETQNTIEWKDEDAEPFWPETARTDWCGEHPDFPAYIKGLTPQALNRA